MPYRILVVDDETDLEILINQRFRKRVRARELEFLFSVNGEEALSQLQANADIDIVLTDINMPVMDGLTLLSRIAAEHPLLKAVIVSAYGDMVNIRAALNRGAFDFVTKPINFDDLEITLNKTLQEAAAKRQAAKDHDRLLAITRELEVARRIQKSLVPSEFPPYPGRTDFSIFGSMTPAWEVGGDLFDFFLLDDDLLGFTIGDVSGKGVSAALFMAVSRTLLRSTAKLGLAPAECIHQVNQILTEENTSPLFVTCFYGVLNTRTGAITYTNAAHNPPFLLRPGGAIRVEATKEPGGLFLGQFAQATYTSETAALRPGDSIFLYTDGITEAMDPSGKLYSEERLEELLGRLPDLDAKQRVQAVLDDVNAFARGATQSDDITLLNITYLGRS